MILTAMLKIIGCLLQAACTIANSTTKDYILGVMQGVRMYVATYLLIVCYVGQC